MGPRIVRTRRSPRLLVLASLVAWASGCASVSTSDTHLYRTGDAELGVSARAERGAMADRLFIVVDGVDVASGPFGAEQAAGTTLRGDFDGLPVEARCGHRWRPGIHIGYRCRVSIGSGDPVELDF